MEIVTYVVNVLLLIWLIIQFFYRYVTGKQIELIITNYYIDLGLEVKEISKLTLTERIKYGVPLNFIMSIYGFFFTIFSRLGDNHFRKIETVNEDNEEQIVYIDLYIKKRKLVELKEFKKYNFK